MIASSDEALLALEEACEGLGAQRAAILTGDLGGLERAHARIDAALARFEAARAGGATLDPLQGRQAALRLRRLLRENAGLMVRARDLVKQLADAMPRGRLDRRA